jgi:predicted Rossmann fold nucleotide-binding protein DprA/Smf involved in DNA uptake
MLVRGDDGWPAGTGCDDLPCLWVRGNTDIAELLSTAVAVTGTRACTEYGAQTTRDLAIDLMENDQSIVTNSGFGIDLHAATAALATDGPAPILLTADGLDHRAADPIGGIVEQTAQRGAVISPFPPGTVPVAARMRLRNRLLGSLTVATVLVEAGVGSDALNALNAAASTGRIACAVPGLVSSPQSGGCHARIADGTATLVTDAGDVITAITESGGGAPGPGLFAVRAVATGIDDNSRRRRVPLFHVHALSHAHAANTAFDVLLGGHRGPAELNVGIHDPAGDYEAITINVEG